MNTRNLNKTIAALFICAAALCISAGTGSVRIPVKDELSIIGNRLFGLEMPCSISGTVASIFWSIRLPRAISAFFVGASLAVSGAVMQSVLQNPLASSYTLGVSSGASLGAAAVIVTGVSLPFAAGLTVPLAGFAAGLFTVLFATGLSARIDHNMKNQTIILVGMVMSLFVNAVLTLLSVLDTEHTHQLLLWQMGTFSAKTWSNAAFFAAVCFAGIFILLSFSGELDILTFGDEQAMSTGVDSAKVKLIIIIAAAFMTGSSVAFTGIIGFIDLIAPHVVRRIFGPRHRIIIPMSALTGGTFMALCDMISRTVLSPREIPVGAVTALIGAPFFTYLFFRKGSTK